MTSSPLKITLKLSGLRPTDSSRPTTPVSPLIKNAREEDSSSTESPRKRAKPNGRSRKPKVEGTPISDR